MLVQVWRGACLAEGAPSQVWGLGLGTYEEQPGAWAGRRGEGGWGRASCPLGGRTWLFRSE